MRSAGAETAKRIPIEVWGRRIGRSLSVVGFVVLVYWLASQLHLL